MSPSSLKHVLRTLETGEIAHADYVAHLSAMKRRIEDTLNGGAPAIEAVLGPSRVGKTMLNNALVRAYPESEFEGCRRVQVLPFVLPTPVTPKEMPIAILDALGAPAGPRSGGTVALFKRMVNQLRLAGVRVLLGEEVSHSVDSGTRVQNRAAADWFKQLVDREFTLILFGLPKLKSLYESNEQFRLRASKPREFRPYDCRNQEEMNEYAKCVRSFAGIFRRAGWPLDVPSDLLVTHCYLLSGGLVGVTSKFMQRLAYDFQFESAPRALTFVDCRKALASFEPAGSPLYPAFTQEEVTPQQLAAAHACVLQMSDLTPKRGDAA
jgi:hypothetical protein